MVTCYLGFGSNVGDRIGMIMRSIVCLVSQGDVVLRRLSSFYLTEPWGYTDQPDFVNAVAQVETYLDPHDLLSRIKSIETSLGRKKTRRWGPRSIDIDILFYGNEIVESSDLTVPHPMIAERIFVLVPLLEIAPEIVHPASRMSLKEMLSVASTNGGMRCERLPI